MLDLSNWRKNKMRSTLKLSEEKDLLIEAIFLHESGVHCEYDNCDFDSQVDELACEVADNLSVITEKLISDLNNHGTKIRNLTWFKRQSKELDILLRSLEQLTDLSDTEWSGLNEMYGNGHYLVEFSSPVNGYYYYDYRDFLGLLNKYGLLAY